MAEELIQLTDQHIVNARYIMNVQRVVNDGYRDGSEDMVHVYMFAGNGATSPYIVEVYYLGITNQFHAWLAAQNLSL